MLTNQNNQTAESPKILDDSAKLRRIRSTIEFPENKVSPQKFEKKFSFLQEEFHFRKKDRNLNDKFSEKTLSSQDTDEVYKKVDFDQSEGIALNVREEVDTFISKPENEPKKILNRRKENPDFTENSSSEKSSESIDSKERLEKGSGDKD